MKNTSNFTTAAIMNLSSLTQYFIPFGNFIFPIIIWSSKKEDSEYLNKQGKQTINFQLSLFLYSVILGLTTITLFIISFVQAIDFQKVINNDGFIINQLQLENLSSLIIIAIIATIVLILLKIAEFFLIIYATLQTSKGEDFKYPLTIPFLK